MNDLIEKLQREKRVLFENLNKGNYDKILKKSEEIEVAIKNEKKMLLLSNVNGEQSRLREKAKQAWECEVPTADITCNDGSFHAAKVKKYPKIAELKYASGLWKEGMLMEIRVNGIKFRMFSATYEHSKPTEYKRPETFEAFLELNSIMEKELTVEEFDSVIEANEVINVNLKKAIETAEIERKKINFVKFRYLNLFGQNTENVYTYSPNF